MLSWIAEMVIRAPRRIIVAALLIAVTAGLVGAGAIDRLGAGGFFDPRSDAMRGTQLLQDTFDSANPNLIVLVSDPDGVDSPTAREVGLEVTEEVAADPHVLSVQSYWQMSGPMAMGLRSTDGTSAVIAVQLDGNETEFQRSGTELADRIGTGRDGVTVTVGGAAIVYRDSNAAVTRDLVRAEMVALPISALVLVWVFGSAIAAMLPLAVGLFSILMTLAILRLLTTVTDVSIFALNLTVALGLAIAIDYSLFIVHRFREERRAALARGETDVDADAVRRTIAVAGRTVLFSALPVIVSMAALVVFPLYFLRSFAYAASAAVAAAALAAVVVLPAILLLLGPRVDALDIRRPIRRLLGRSPSPSVEPEDSGWYRLADRIVRRPVLPAAAVVIVLLTLGIPFLHLTTGFTDDRALNEQVPSRVVGDALRNDFAQDPTASITIVVPDGPTDPNAYADYATELSRVPDVTAVLAPDGIHVGGLRIAPAPPDMLSGTVARITVASGVTPFSDQGAQLVDAVRAVRPPAEVMYTGAAELNAESMHTIATRLPIALAWIALTTFLVLFVFTGSVVLPLKAILMNLLSLSATFGAMVWIFQDGNLSGLFGFEPTGYLNATLPLLMFCLAFGVSMDYEIFILSRIAEQWRSGDGSAEANRQAVALGIAQTGRIITAAALLMAIVLSALVSSSVSFIQMFGLGLALMVLIDATLVRAILVPAFMGLLGRWNWWAPAPLARLHRSWFPPESLRH
ncbi:MMPL family transporter [Millisia brevis]|uniref:MMPL family transporter n=1 Tax=Millisia brevis TaxID=264148 RepID=UPI00082D70DA|nr:MMPL family transporter [Millisia brevis]